VWEIHRETGGPIAGLEVRRPTLEDTYLHMVRREDTGGDGDVLARAAGDTGGFGEGIEE
jgi:ABC-2 type transport system ATP-binding protein